MSIAARYSAEGNSDAVAAVLLGFAVQRWRCLAAYRAPAAALLAVCGLAALGLNTPASAPSAPLPQLLTLAEPTPAALPAPALAPAPPRSPLSWLMVKRVLAPTPAPMPAPTLVPNLAERPRQDWEGLDPTFGARLRRVFEIMQQRHGYQMTLLEGYRDPERQQRLLRAGATKLGAYQSYHQYGLAADCAFLVDGRVVLSERDPWAMRGYRLYGQVAAEVGLAWGGQWAMRDFGHVEWQRAGGKALAMAVNGTNFSTATLIASGVDRNSLEFNDN